MLGNPDRPIGGLAVRPPAGVELRPLGRGDLEAAVAMGRERRELTAFAEPERLRDRYEALLNDPDTVAFLALAEGQAAGMSALSLRRRLNFATFEGWLAELYVRPAHGGQGIGRALLDASLAEWRLRGSHRVLAPVGLREDAGRRLLEGAGFEQGFVDYRLAPVPLPEPPAASGLAVRSVELRDAEAVTRLIAEFGPRRSPVPDRMEAVLRTFGMHLRAVEAGRAGTLVAELEGRVVGVCTLEWQLPIWTDALIGWIPELVVTEPVRGRGIGRALLAHALHRAAERGVAEVRLESGPQRATAHALYRSVGFEEAGQTWVLRREE